MERKTIGTITIASLLAVVLVEGIVIWHLRGELQRATTSAAAVPPVGAEVGSANNADPAGPPEIPLKVLLPARFPAFFLSLSMGMRAMYRAPGSPVVLGLGQVAWPKWPGTVEVLSSREEGDHAFVSVRYKVQYENGNTEWVKSDWELVRTEDGWLLYDITPATAAQTLPLW